MKVWPSSSPSEIVSSPVSSLVHTQLRHLSKCLRTLRKKVSKNPHPTSLTNWKSKLWIFVIKFNLQNHSESRAVANFAGNCNSKIYNYIQSLSNSSTIPSTVFLNTASATWDSEKADVFNMFLHSVYKPSLSNSSFPPCSEPTWTYPNITNFLTKMLIGG